MCDCRWGGNHISTHVSLWERHSRQVRLHQGQGHRGKISVCGGGRNPFSSTLACLWHHFFNLLALFHVSIWSRARRRHLERGGKTWTGINKPNHLSVIFRQTNRKSALFFIVNRGHDVSNCARAGTVPEQDSWVLCFCPRLNAAQCTLRSVNW